MEKNSLFQLRRKTDNFWWKKPTHQKTLIFAVKKERVNEDLKKCEIYGRQRDSNTPPPASQPWWHSANVSYKTPTTLQICELCASWVLPGHRKNADYWIEYFPFEKKFFRRRKMPNLYSPVGVTKQYRLVDWEVIRIVKLNWKYINNLFHYSTDQKGSTEARTVIGGRRFRLCARAERMKKAGCRVRYYVT